MRNIKTVLILDMGDTGNESEAIRQALEWFNYRVLRFCVGRPNDFIEVLSGEYGVDFDYLIISCHGGDDGEFLMPELGEEIYLQDEPREHFGAEHIKKYNKLQNKIIISTGCETGSNNGMNNVFTTSKNKFIAPIDGVDGNSVLPYLTALFYLLTQDKHDLQSAHKKASSLDKETKLFKLFE